MTSAVMHRVARAVSRSRLGEAVLVYLDGVEHATRAIRVREETVAEDPTGRFVRREHRIRVPVADLSEAPVSGDTVEGEGGVLHVVGCLEDGPTYVITLSARRPD